MGVTVDAPAATLPLLPATGRMDIRRVPHCEEIQVCEQHAEPWHQHSHQLIQNKEDHFSQLAFCHLDLRFPVTEGDAFAVCTCNLVLHNQKDPIRGCQTQLYTHSTANSASFQWTDLCFLLTQSKNETQHCQLCFYSHCSLISVVSLCLLSPPQMALFSFLLGFRMVQQWWLLHLSQSRV